MQRVEDAGPLLFLLKRAGPLALPSAKTSVLSYFLADLLLYRLSFFEVIGL